MELVELENQDADQISVLIYYLKSKMKEDLEDEEFESSIPLLRGLLKNLIEEHLGETYETPVLLDLEASENDVDDSSVLDEFDF